MAKGVLRRSRIKVIHFSQKFKALGYYQYPSNRPLHCKYVTEIISGVNVLGQISVNREPGWVFSGGERKNEAVTVGMCLF